MSDLQSLQKLNQIALDFAKANTDKNEALKRETKAKKALEDHVRYDGNVTLRPNNHLTVTAEMVTTESTEIDPQKVFERYPNLFWKIVKIGKTDAETVLGSFGATECSRVVTSTSIKVKAVDHSKGNKSGN